MAENNYEIGRKSASRFYLGVNDINEMGGARQWEVVSRATYPKLVDILHSPYGETIKVEYQGNNPNNLNCAFVSVYGRSGLISSGIFDLDKKFKITIHEKSPEVV